MGKHVATMFTHVTVPYQVETVAREWHSLAWAQAHIINASILTTSTSSCFSPFSFGQVNSTPSTITTIKPLFTSATHPLNHIHSRNYRKPCQAMSSTTSSPKSQPHDFQGDVLSRSVQTSRFFDLPAGMSAIFSRSTNLSCPANVDIELRNIIYSYCIDIAISDDTKCWKGYGWPINDSRYEVHFLNITDISAQIRAEFCSYCLDNLHMCTPLCLTESYFDLFHANIPDVADMLTADLKRIMRVRARRFDSIVIFTTWLTIRRGAEDLDAVRRKRARCRLQNGHEHGHFHCA
jgi:hypothetical protein